MSHICYPQIWMNATNFIFINQILYWNLINTSSFVVCDTFILLNILLENNAESICSIYYSPPPLIFYWPQIKNMRSNNMEYVLITKIMKAQKTIENFTTGHDFFAPSWQEKKKKNSSLRITHFFFPLLNTMWISDTLKHVFIPYFSKNFQTLTSRCLRSKQFFNFHAIWIYLKL